MRIPIVVSSLLLELEKFYSKPKFEPKSPTRQGWGVSVEFVGYNMLTSKLQDLAMLA